MELHATPVRVTAVYPAITRTPILAPGPLLTEARRTALERNMDRTPALSPDRVARKIVHGIRANRSRVRTGPDTVVVDLLSRILPSIQPRLIARPIAAYIAFVVDKSTRSAAGSP